jgi:arginine repressor
MYDKILRLHTVDAVPENGTISYLDYYYDGLDESDESDTKVIGLKVLQKFCPRVDVEVPVSETQDPGVELEKHLYSKIFHEILELSAKTKKEVQKNFNTPLDVYREDLDDETLKRKIMTRILMAANTVAMRSRRGPANFVILSSDLLSLLLDKNVGTICGLDQVFTISRLVPNIDVVVSDEISKKVVVGRRPAVDEDPGMHLFVTNEDLTGNRVSFDETGITGVNVSYILATCGNTPESNYMEFDVYI